MLGEIIQNQDIAGSYHLSHRKEDSLISETFHEVHLSLEGILRGMQMEQQKKRSLSSSALDDYPGHQASAAAQGAGAHTDTSTWKGEAT